MPYVIHPFIFVYLCSSGLLSFCFLYSSFSFPQSLFLSVYFLRVLAPLHPFHSLVLFSRSWCCLFFFILTYFCSADVFLLRSRCSSILTIPSLWLIRRLISPHCHSFLIPFLSHTQNCPLSLLLATSLVFFSALLAPLSSPCLEFRLLIYTLVSCIHHFPLSLPLFASGVLLFSSFFHVFTTAVELFSLLYLLLLLILVSDSFLARTFRPTLSGISPSFSSFVRPSFSFAWVEGLFPRCSRPVKNLAGPKRFQSRTLRVNMRISVKLFIGFFKILHW